MDEKFSTAKISQSTVAIWLSSVIKTVCVHDEREREFEVHFSSRVYKDTPEMRTSL